MKFEFSNVGRIRSGTVELGDLTILCGRNSSGKTYATYAIHGFLRNFGSLARATINPQSVEDLHEEGAIALDLLDAFRHRDACYKRASSAVAQSLPDYFSVAPQFFEESAVSVSPPEWAKEADLVESSAVFSTAGYSAVKEPGSTELVVSAKGVEARFPKSFVRNLIGQWVTQAGVGFCVPSPFAITSERTGVSLFYKDLDLSRNQVMERILQANGQEIDLFDLALKNSSRYALPVRENIEAVRGFEAISKRKSFIVEHDPHGVIEALDDLLGGSFVSDQDMLNFTFKVKGVRKRQRVPIYVASSAVKSLFLLNMFVRHQAVPNSVLIIDEPELNLHPENQRKIARLLVRLVNSGVRVFATTHSDFILREISAMVALDSLKSTKETSQFLKAWGLGPGDLLPASRVKTFSVESGVIDAVPMSEMGIEIESINDEISQANRFYEDSLLLGS